MLRVYMVVLEWRRGSPEEGIGQGPSPLPLLSQRSLLRTARHIEGPNEGKEAATCECNQDENRVLSNLSEKGDAGDPLLLRFQSSRH